MKYITSVSFFDINILKRLLLFSVETYRRNLNHFQCSVVMTVRQQTLEMANPYFQVPVQTMKSIFFGAKSKDCRNNLSFQVPF